MKLKKKLKIEKHRVRYVLFINGLTLHSVFLKLNSFKELLFRNDRGLNLLSRQTFKRALQIISFLSFFELKIPVATWASDITQSSPKRKF